MTARPATSGDLPRLIDLWEEGWHDAHGTIAPQALVAMRTRETFAERTERRLHQTRVIDGAAGQGLSGFTMISGDELYQFYVARTARGTGVAAELMADALAVFAANGIETAWLIATVGNDRAARFYEKCGWHLAATEMTPVETSEGPFDVLTWRFEIAVPAAR